MSEKSALDAVKKGAAWVSVSYRMDAIGVHPADTFNVRVEEAFPGAVTNEQRIQLLQNAIEDFLLRFPNFALAMPEHVPGFIIETRGRGVVWFTRKP